MREFNRSYGIIALLLVWEALSRANILPKRLFPSLSTIGSELIDLATSGELLFHGLITLQRVMLGFGAAVVGGLLLGGLLARSKTFRELVEPTLLLTYPVPRICLYPLLVLALGFGDTAKIILIFLECVYPIALQTYSGMTKVDKKLIWAAENMGATSTQIFWRVLLPSSLPYIFAGIRIALPVAFILTIVTEIIGESRGLGYLIAFSASSYEHARALAVLAVTGAMGFTFDILAVALQRVVTRDVPARETHA
jgi:ABC-type nitrate/sulfonate/bicarbonate transport system permease component